MYRENPQAALNETVNIYGGMVYKVVFSRLAQRFAREDIEEIVSDVFVQFYRNADKIDLQKGTVKAYISVIAKNLALRRAEQLNRRDEQIPLEDVSETVVDGGAAGEFERTLNRRILLEAVKALGKPDSDIIIMKYFYGMKSREIGAALGIKTNTVDKKISRALERLRKTIRKEDF
jgi:RNA polymerase sigma-70 factor (ECF subfamily)